MKVNVIIPVGPGHETEALGAIQSVETAWAHDPGPFSAMHLAVVNDTLGELGRSAARNRGMDQLATDWHFLLDADDEMMPDAFGLVDLDAPATFGAICLNGRIARRNRYPVTRQTLFEHGADGTLSMGCFVRGDLGIRFDESLRVGEDFDFYMRLPGFVKLTEPLVNIRYRAGASATEAGWAEACATVIDRYRLTQERA